MNTLARRNNSDLDFFNDFFDGFFTTPSTRNLQQCMRTDIQENEKGYSLDIEVPGFGKEDIKISLENGYLTVEAKREDSKEKKEYHFLRRERFYGTAARTFFVGEDITQEDIKAAYDRGILTLSIPKQGSLVKEKKYIDIE
ncbi:MAG TPA: Hsp20/alpha crystallin family protein [Candidatus Izemoplasmatales bacterium]|nr:Hsp20/alpha crystallin family protein [Bacillota bacterium]HRY78207.1 Hsp20/alpha crystallin family protein [Candidatus Izemoplasmatales bacterium]